MLRNLSLCCLLLCSGCFVPQDAKPSVDIGVNLASKFVHRGMTMVNREVLQPHLDVALPTVTEGQLRVRTEGTMELHNSTGAAWFPNGHASRFTQIEMLADWSQKVGVFDLSAGIHSYNLPNGLEFPNGERGGTTEIFTTVSTEILEARPYLSAHYDYDEVRSTYLRLGLTEDFDLGKGFTLDLDGSLGYAGAGQSAWMYGIREAGFADLRGSVILNYAYDERTTLAFGLHGSMIVDSTIDAWFGQLGIDSDPIWADLGVAWAF